MGAGADIRPGPFSLPTLIMMSRRSVLAFAVRLYDRVKIRPDLTQDRFTPILQFAFAVGIPNEASTNL